MSVPMSNFDACMIAEGQFDLAGVDVSEMESWEQEELFIAAFQQLIDTGLVWSLQGRFGRTAVDLIESGQCSPAAPAARGID